MARVDPRFDRERGVLELRGPWWEKGVKATRARREKLDEAVDRLAVFVGDFDLVAAQAVVAEADGRTLDVLERLVSKSLLTVGTERGSPRYRLLETTRAFAIDRLTRTRGKLMDYSLRAVSQGKDALGEVTVKVDFGDGELVTGKGASTDVIEASAKAYIEALNVLARSVSRHASA